MNWKAWAPFGNGTVCMVGAGGQVCAGCRLASDRGRKVSTGQPHGHQEGKLGVDNSKDKVEPVRTNSNPVHN